MNPYTPPSFPKLHWTKHLQSHPQRSSTIDAAGWKNEELTYRDQTRLEKGQTNATHAACIPMNRYRYPSRINSAMKTEPFKSRSAIRILKRVVVSKECLITMHAISRYSTEHMLID